MFRTRRNSHQMNARRTSRKPKAEMIRRYMRMMLAREDEVPQIGDLSSGDETAPIAPIYTNGMFDQLVPSVFSTISAVDRPSTNEVPNEPMASVPATIAPVGRPTSTNLADGQESAVSSTMAAVDTPTSSKAVDREVPSMSSAIAAVVRPTTSAAVDEHEPSASSIINPADKATTSKAVNEPPPAPVRVAVVRPTRNKVAGLQILPDRPAFRCARVRSQPMVPNRPDRDYVPVAVVKPFGFTHSPSGSTPVLADSDGTIDSSKTNSVPNLIPSSHCKLFKTARSPATYHVRGSTKSQKLVPTPKGEIKNKYLSLVCPGRRQRLRKVIKRSRGSRNRILAENRAEAAADRAHAEAVARRTRMKKPTTDSNVSPENMPKKSVRDIYLCPHREQFRRKQRYMAVNTCNSSSDETTSSEYGRELHRVRKGVKKSKRCRNISLIRRMLKASLVQRPRR